MNGDVKVLDVLNLISLYLGVLNLNLNTQQTKSLDKHLKSQDDELFKKIIDQNEYVIKLLEDFANAQKDIRRSDA